MNKSRSQKADRCSDAAYQRMLAARPEIRRLHFSDEAWANPYPAHAPEVVGIHSPDVMRAELKHRAVG